MEEYKKFLNDGDKARLVKYKRTVKATVKDNITVDSIIDTLMNNKLTKNDNYCIRSKKHKLGIYEKK